ncbi:MAG: trypsin-like peptidase domain-containing protein [Patescibacteria group bacterium]
MFDKNILQPRIIVPLVVISMLSGLAGSAIFSKMDSPSSPSILKVLAQEEDGSRHYIEESDSIEAIKKVAPAVLSIVATKDLEIFKQQPLDPFFPFGDDPFFRNFGLQIPQQQPQQKQQAPETKRQKVSGGTGFIIGEDGLALTNKHVVADTDADYTAVTKEGKEYDVEIISRDPVNDLAVIQLHEHKDDDDNKRKTGEKKDFGDKPKGMPVAGLGDSTKLQVGQKVLAIGNARGEYENSVTAGIISAVNREIQASAQGGGMSETLSGLIQTDAAINFGNSGGPLINLAGEVIGVNTAVDASASGIGFAIPVNQIKPALASVEKFGRIVRPILGVKHVILTKENAKEYKLEALDHGALIVGDRSKKEFGVMPGSPAEKAGLRIDDVILEVNGEKVTEDNNLQSMVQKRAPGDTLRLKVWRASRTFNTSVKLEEKKE